MEMFATQSGIKLLHAPFTGAGPAVVALLSGSVDALSTGPSSVIGHVKAGKVRVLASWGESRHPALPDVPTFKELGYNVQFSQWAGLFVPAGTAEPIVTRLREASRAAVNDESMRNVFARIETPIQYLDAPEFAKFWEADAKVMADVVKRIGKLE
jgi:tripartite-type tricarboxylate transporter receptor subunit TctC